MEGYKQAVSLVLSALITISIILFNPAVAIQERLGEWGYLGVFLIMLISSGTVILPAPGLISVFMAGGAYNFLIIGLVGGLGSALGELTGYMLGYGTSAFIPDEKNPLYKETREWMKKNGFLTIFVLSALPNPAFDIAGIISGSLQYPWWMFLLSCFLGKTLKSTIVAYLGYLVLF